MSCYIFRSSDGLRTHLNVLIRLLSLSISGTIYHGGEKKWRTNSLIRQMKQEQEKYCYRLKENDREIINFRKCFKASFPCSYICFFFFFILKNKKKIQNISSVVILSSSPLPNQPIRHHLGWLAAKLTVVSQNGRQRKTFSLTREKCFTSTAKTGEHQTTLFATETKWPCSTG